jgi:hypothetical protein
MESQLTGSTKVVLGVLSETTIEGLKHFSPQKSHATHGIWGRIGLINELSEDLCSM